MVACQSLSALCVKTNSLDIQCIESSHIRLVGPLVHLAALHCAASLLVACGVMDRPQACLYKPIKMQKSCVKQNSWQLGVVFQY